MGGLTEVVFCCCKSDKCKIFFEITTFQIQNRCRNDYVQPYNDLRPTYKIVQFTVEEEDLKTTLLNSFLSTYDDVNFRLIQLVQFLNDMISSLLVEDEMLNERDFEAAKEKANERDQRGAFYLENALFTKNQMRRKIGNHVVKEDIFKIEVVWIGSLYIFFKQDQSYDINTKGGGDLTPHYKISIYGKKKKG